MHLASDTHCDIDAGAMIDFDAELLLRLYCIAVRTIHFTPGLICRFVWLSVQVIRSPLKLQYKFPDQGDRLVRDNNGQTRYVASGIQPWCI